LYLKLIKTAASHNFNQYTVMSHFCFVPTSLNDCAHNKK
jgi:hypothetical protein